MNFRRAFITSSGERNENLFSFRPSDGGKRGLKPYGLPWGLIPLTVLLFALCPIALVRADTVATSTISGQVATSSSRMEVSSWYHARHTYDVASNDYPVGTKFLITNPKNNATTTGIVAGTGPFIKGRTLDVSMHIAQLLGFKGAGTAKLLVSVLE